MTICCSFGRIIRPKLQQMVIAKSMTQTPNNATSSVMRGCLEAVASLVVDHLHREIGHETMRGINTLR